MRLVKEYCCCAIPLLNAGIYLTLIEQLAVSAAAGILTLTTPPVVGASVPFFVPIVFAAMCFVVSAVQLLGFLGVLRESTILFRRYTTLHFMSLIAVFVFSAVFIGMSGSKHDTAAAQCVKNFFPVDPTVTHTALTGSDTEGKLLCDIFTWIGLGTMAGLWTVFLIFHTYLYFVISGYGENQRADHSKYYSLYSVNDSFAGPRPETHPSFLTTDNIGMKNLGPSVKADSWDTRDSMETVGFEKQPQQEDGLYQQPRRQASGRGTFQDGPKATYPHVPVLPGPYNPYQDPYYQEAGGTSGALGDTKHSMMYTGQ